MSACCSTYGNVAGAHFDEKIAKRDLESYRKKGPGTTARLLRDLLVGTGAVKGVLLDVGSGVGGLSFELLDRGAERVIAVDASPAYLAAAAQEATRRDRLGVVEFIHGDFVDVGPQIPSATIVTLDRVICCYPSFEPLLNEALRHVEHAFAYSYPRDLWYVHSAIGVENAVRRLKGNPFRAFVHPVDRMTQTIERVGFHLAGRRQTWQWSADVWVRWASVTATLRAVAEGAKCDEALGLGISVGARFPKPAALSAVIEMLENRRKWSDDIRRSDTVSASIDRRRVRKPLNTNRIPER